MSELNIGIIAGRVLMHGNPTKEEIEEVIVSSMKRILCEQRQLQQMLFLVFSDKVCIAPVSMYFVDDVSKDFFAKIMRTLLKRKDEIKAYLLVTEAWAKAINLKNEEDRKYASGEKAPCEAPDKIEVAVLFYQWRGEKPDSRIFKFKRGENKELIGLIEVDNAMAGAVESGRMVGFFDEQKKIYPVDGEKDEKENL